MPLPSWAALLLSSRRRQPSDTPTRGTDVRLHLTHLEDRRVLNGAPMVVAAGVGGDHHASTVDVVLKGSQLEVFVDATLVRSESLDGVSSLEIDGDPDGTKVTLDFSGGDPTPSGGIDFKGAGDSADENTLQLKPGADTSIFGSVAYIVSGAGVSSISLSHAGNATTSTITVSGVANVQDSLVADHRSFDVSGGAIDTTLTASSSSGSSFSQLITTFGSSVMFDNPNSSLTITATGTSAAGTDSTLHLAGVGSNFNADLSVSGFGSVQVDTATDVGAGQIAISANEIDIFAALRSTGPAAELVAQQLITISSSGSVAVGNGGSIGLNAPNIDDAGLLSALGGNVMLDASGGAASTSGTLWVSGVIDASDLRTGATGGNVELLGDYIGVLDGAD